jgi:hypothetical protein
MTEDLLVSLCLTPSSEQCSDQTGRQYQIYFCKKVVALFLAAYGIVACFLDIDVLSLLREPWRFEKVQGTAADENVWGYGQILAVFIWAPVLVEYVHGLINSTNELKQESPSKESLESNNTGQVKADPASAITEYGT